jgi:hypothetical protein
VPPQQQGFNPTYANGDPVLSWILTLVQPHLLIMDEPTNVWYLPF